MALSRHWSRGILGEVQYTIFETEREITIIKWSTSLEFSNRNSHTFRGNTFVSIGFPVFTTN
jgi:hypothetical protein